MTDGQTHTHTDGTDSITLTTDAGGKNLVEIWPQTTEEQPEYHSLCTIFNKSLLRHSRHDSTPTMDI